MRLLLPGLLLLTACHFDTTTQAARPDADPTAPDANPFQADADPSLPDADPTAPDATPCPTWNVEPSFFTPCQDLPEATEPLVLNLAGEYTYHTTNGILLPPGGAIGDAILHRNTTLGIGPRDARVINAAGFQIASGASLRATGSRPLLIVSWGAIDIAGDIDVSSELIVAAMPGDFVRVVGAGGSADQCNLAGDGGEPGNPAGADQEGGGGGGGGGYGAAGGAGGAGDTELVNVGGVGGASKALAFHGGCAGGRGGLGDGPLTPVFLERGIPGAGGGAVLLSARTTITVSGTINAGGMGGGGGQNNRAAGGGGGSGGLIGLEAATITLQTDSILAANGGGGGGGGNNTASGPGQAGQPDSVAALGGVGDQNDGGVGGFLETGAGQVGLTGSRGGGGGGGGVGFIVLRGASVSSDMAEEISPAPLTPVIPISAQ